MSAQNTVSGRVIDRRTGGGIVAATVATSSRPAVTDSTGHFTLTDCPDDTMRVRVRRMGYAPLDTTVVRSTADSLHLLFALSPLPLRLDTVSVRAIGDRPGVILEFEERRLHGLGRYIGRDELRKNDDRVLAEVLRSRMPGLGFQQIRGMVWLRSPSARCFTNIYLDGMPIFRNNDLFVGKEPPDFNSLFTREFDAIEYYAHPSSAPVQYRAEGAVCGVLLLWTRRR